MVLKTRVLYPIRPWIQQSILNPLTATSRRASGASCLGVVVSIFAPLFGGDQRKWRSLILQS